MNRDDTFTAGLWFYKIEEYEQAIPFFLELANKPYSDPLAMRHLADCYNQLDLTAPRDGRRRWDMMSTPAEWLASSRNYNNEQFLRWASIARCEEDILRKKISDIGK